MAAGDITVTFTLAERKALCEALLQAMPGRAESDPHLYSMTQAALKLVYAGREARALDCLQENRRNALTVITGGKT